MRVLPPIQEGENADFDGEALEQRALVETARDQGIHSRIFTHDFLDSDALTLIFTRLNKA